MQIVYRRALRAAGLAALCSCVPEDFTTNVDNPLRVIALSPPGGAEGIARDVTVVATFNLDVVPESVTADTFFLQRVDASRVAAAISYVPSSDASPPRATLKPEARLEYSARYEVVLSAGIQRQGAPPGHLLKEVRQTFTTGHPPPLRLVSSAPADGAAGVSWVSGTAGLQLIFSEPMRCSSLSNISVTEDYDPVVATRLGRTSQPVGGSWKCTEPQDPEQVTCDAGACTVSFVPDANHKFFSSSKVKVVLSGGTGANRPKVVESLRATDFGGQLPATLTIAFQLEHPPAFEVLAVAPELGVNGYKRSGTVSVTFSQPVDCAAPLLNFVRIAETLDPYTSPAVDVTTGTTLVSCAAEKMVLKPGGTAFQFQFSSRAALTLRDGLPSTNVTSQGGTLAKPVSVDFIVEHPPPLLVSFSRPQQGASGVDPATPIEIHFAQQVTGWTLNCATLVPGTALTGTTTVVVSVQPDGAASYTPVNPSDLTFSCAADATTITPNTPFAFKATVRVELSARVASTIRTSQGGTLPGPFTLDFSIAVRPPLAVVSIDPKNNEVNVNPARGVIVEFNQALILGSLCIPRSPGFDECAATSGFPATFDKSLCCLGATYVQRACVVPDGADYTAYRGGNNAKCVATTATFDFTASKLTLAPGTLATGVIYRVVLRGGGSPILGMGGQPMPSDFESRFTVGVVNTKVAGVQPTVTTNVSHTTDLCVTLKSPSAFDPGQVQASHVQVTYVDSFGATQSVAGTIALSNANRTLCFTPTPFPHDCADDPVKLLPNTAHTAVFAAATPLTGGDTLGSGGDGPVTLSFTTAPALAPSDVTARNPLATDDLDDLLVDDDVPVNATFWVTLPEVVAASSGSEMLLHPAGSPNSPLAGTIDYPRDASNQIIDPKTLVLTVSGADPDRPLAHASEFVLVVKSGVSGPVSTSGRYLDRRRTYRFKTSPALEFMVTPGVVRVPATGIKFKANTLVSFLFSRPIDSASWNAANVRFLESTAVDFSAGSTVLAGAYAVNDAQSPRTALYTPTPGFLANNYVRVSVSPKLRDFRGNPAFQFVILDHKDTVATGDDTRVVEPVGSGISLAWDQTAGFSQNPPTGLAMASATPAAGATAVAGDAVVGFAFPNSGQQHDLILPSSVRLDSSSAALSTVWVEAAGTLVRGVATFLPGRFTTPPENHRGDVVLFRPDPESLFNAGQTYTVHVRQPDLANVNNFAPTAAEQTWTFTIESTPPTVLRVCAFDVSVKPTPSAADIDAPCPAVAGPVPPDSVFAVVMSETLRPSTVSSTTATLENPAGQVVPATVSLLRWRNDVILVRPLAYLAKGATGYALRLASGVADAAGNALAATSVALNTTSTGAGVALQYDGNGDGLPDTSLTCAANVPAAASLFARFDRQMNLATLATSTLVLSRGTVNTSGAFTAAGSVNACVKVAEDELSHTLAKVYPASLSLAAGTVHQLKVTGAADIGGHAIQGDPLADEFSTGADFGAGACVP